MTDTAAPATSRSIVTEIPGPRSRELQERRLAAVASGVGSVLPPGAGTGFTCR